MPVGCAGCAAAGGLRWNTSNSPVPGRVPVPFRARLPNLSCVYARCSPDRLWETMAARGLLSLLLSLAAIAVMLVGTEAFLGVPMGSNSRVQNSRMARFAVEKGEVSSEHALT